MSEFTDKSLRCVTCGQDFTFTAGEQQFHATKGFTNEPRRCRACRQARRGPAEANAAPAGAGGANAAGSAPRGQVATAARPAGAERASDSRADRAERGGPNAEPARGRFVTVCSACGGEAVLNQEPVGNRASLCSACYEKIRAFN